MLPVLPSHVSPNDGTSVFAGVKTITTAAFPFVVDDVNCIVLFVMRMPLGGVWQTLEQGEGGISLSATANVITVEGYGDNFVATDTFHVGVVKDPKEIVGGSTGIVAGSVAMLVQSGPGCDQWQVATGGGDRANTGTVSHCGKVVGITKVVLVAGVKSEIDCGLLAVGVYDAVLESDTAGVDGNIKTFRLQGDSGAGVTISVVGTDMVAHFQPGVSTPALVDAAITGAASIIRVKTASTVVAFLAAPADEFVATPLTGGADGAAGQVVCHGKIRNPAWTWNVGAPVYLNTNALSETDPVIGLGLGFNQQIGVAVSTGGLTTDTIDVDLGDPVLA